MGVASRRPASPVSGLRIPVGPLGVAKAVLCGRTFAAPRFLQSRHAAATMSGLHLPFGTRFLESCQKPCTRRPRGRRWARCVKETLRPEGKVMKKSLAILLLLLVIGCGESDPSTQSRREAVAALEKLGGEIETDTNKVIHSVNLNGTQISDDDLVHLRNFTNLLHVSLEQTQITDAGLVHLG